MEEKLEATKAELAELREQHNALNKTFEDERAAWKADKKTLEDTIVDMTTSEKHLESDRSSREHEIRSIEERAKVSLESSSFCNDIAKSLQMSSPQPGGRRPILTRSCCSR